MERSAQLRLSSFHLIPLPGFALGAVDGVARLRAVGGAADALAAGAELTGADSVVVAIGACATTEVTGGSTVADAAAPLRERVVLRRAIASTTIVAIAITAPAISHGRPRFDRTLDTSDSLVRAATDSGGTETPSAGDRSLDRSRAASSRKTPPLVMSLNSDSAVQLSTRAT